MNICPSCNVKISFSGLEKSGRYVGDKKWYQFASLETCCPHCKVPLRSVSRHPAIGLAGIVVMMFVNVALAVWGNDVVYILVFGGVIGISLLVFYCFSFKVEAYS
ncbi:MAG: hypothetical protein KUG78_20840 [Kangiellaceae bacterium]|nr:hypothetical protein [Kangiellaceae bacterium]